MLPQYRIGVRGQRRERVGQLEPFERRLTLFVAGEVAQREERRPRRS